MKFDFNEIIQSFDDRRDIAIPGKKQTTIDFCLEHFIKKAEEAIADHGFFAVALSGGSTPHALFGALAKEENRKRIPWNQVLLFWSDERCVPPDHPDSNYRMAMESGLKSLEIPPQNIFRMHGEEQPETAAKNYDFLLQEEVPFETFDLMMLGMGEDGHTASLFPKTHALHTVGKMATANFVSQKHTWRLTLTFDCINAAKNIAIYVLGENKAEILSKVLNTHYDPDIYPIQKVGTPASKALFILDSEAAAKIR